MSKGEKRLVAEGNQEDVKIQADSLTGTKD